MYRDFAVSIRGYGHVREDLKRQDSVSTAVAEGSAWSLAVTADGHGGKDYFRSDVGARLAVECAIQVVEDYLGDMRPFLEALEKDPRMVLRRMEMSIISRWSSAIEAYDAQNRELTQWEWAWCVEKGVTVQEERRERLYGTTLVLSVLAPRFALAIQIGDGACVAVYGDGEAECFLQQAEMDRAANLTDSLCQPDALERFIHRWVLFPQKGDGPACKGSPAGSRRPVACIVSTDGLANSCVSGEDFLRFNRRVLSWMDEPQARSFLEKHLYERSTRSSHDDISMGLVFEAGLDFPCFRPAAATAVGI